MSSRDDDRTARQIARARQRGAGDRSAQLAAELMKLPEPQLAQLELDDDLRADIVRARAVTTHIARRRAERTLAGELRRYDLGEVAASLAKLEGSKHAGIQQFHLAEKWRARLIDEGVVALASFPGGADDKLPALIDAAQRERATGLPRGASRALFRHVVELLKPARDPAEE
ncbi:MAG: ribosome biogenesis factor YjgA [Acidobacteriota bacterium]